MAMPKIHITKHKDGRETAWFADSQGRVRTSMGMTGATIASQGYSAFRDKWVRADQVKRLAEYGISLQVEQVRAGIGSDGATMPPLKGGRRAAFVARRDGKAVFTRKTYADWKTAHGLQPVRDLYGPGKDGHMLDEIRINFLDDSRATFAITSKTGRDKARANERRAPWWGWTNESVRKLTALAAEVFQTGTAEALFGMGLIGASALAEAKAIWRKVA